MSNPIFEELSRRAPGGEIKSIEDKLVDLYTEIKEIAVVHLSRVKDFLPEFDDHSINHSEAVLDIIAKIIGEQGIKTLSVYELFILAASAYMHDFGMALTGYEEKVLELAEKQPLPVAIDGIGECKRIIRDHGNAIFGTQLPEALQVRFLPHEETKLIEFLAQLYQEYQSYRNGYSEKYRNAKDETEKAELNKGMRMDFIREPHPKRSAQYAQNWGSRFEEENACISKVLNDVAKVVQSHGESLIEIKKLNRCARYQLTSTGSNVANLQFASMMLRLGDIVHFTFDRAPVNLRREVKFNSEVSRGHWMAKNGVSNQINKLDNQTEIVFNAQCTTPQSYCYLKKYIDDINQEVDNFNKLKFDWDEQYQIPLVPVIDEVEPLNGAFETKPDLTFTLNQNKIIDMLMGAQLYQDPYACLRELYQNSLDACRFAIARRSLKEKDPKCTIEFGVKEEDDGSKYLYCLDDGKGMSEDIIEHYFLKIGNSYYKSKEFYSEWAKYKSNFTPTSQFGIGILSCFMIGDRLEVLTKEHKGKLIAFGVDGPQETFYYWRDNDHISLSEKEIIEKQGSGTLVKVYLKEQYAREIDDGELDKLELLKCCDFSSYYGSKLDNYKPSNSTDDDETKYVNLFNRWRRHFYKKVFDFVQLPFSEITVKVRFANSPDSIEIEPRPHLAKVDLAAFEEDKKYYGMYHWKSWKNNSHLKGYLIDISRSNYIYHSMLYLPTEEVDNCDYNEYVYSGICVDGVSIGSKDDFEDNTYKYSFQSLAEKGIFSFMGERKPAIKIDRRSFVNKIHIEDPEQLFSDYLEEVIRVTNEHIETYHIGIGSQWYQRIWGRVISRIPRYLKTQLANHFDKKGYPLLSSDKLADFMSENANLSELMSRSSIKLHHTRMHWSIDPDVFLIKKLSSVKSVTFTQDGELQLVFSDLPKLPYSNIDVSDYVVGLSEEIGLYRDYDILLPYYPLVSHRFAKALKKNMVIESGTCIGEFSPRVQEFLMGQRRFSQREIPIRYQNKVIFVYRVNERDFDLGYYLRDKVSDDLSYVCLYGWMDSDKEQSIILPKNEYSDNCFIVVEGRLTREEMDRMVKYCRYERLI